MKIDEESAKRVILDVTHPDVQIVLLELLDGKSDTQVIAHLQVIHHCGHLSASTMFAACMESIEEKILFHQR